MFRVTDGMRQIDVFLDDPPDMVPCPFCGWDGVEVHVEELLGVGMVEPEFYCVCDRCLARGPGCTDYSDAVAGWNRRAGERGMS